MGWLLPLEKNTRNPIRAAEIKKGQKSMNHRPPSVPQAGSRARGTAVHQYIRVAVVFLTRWTQSVRAMTNKPHVQWVFAKKHKPESYTIWLVKNTHRHQDSSPIFQYKSRRLKPVGHKNNILLHFKTVFSIKIFRRKILFRKQHHAMNVNRFQILLYAMH